MSWLLPSCLPPPCSAGVLGTSLGKLRGCQGAKQRKNRTSRIRALIAARQDPEIASEHRAQQITARAPNAEDIRSPTLTFRIECGTNHRTRARALAYLGPRTLGRKSRPCGLSCWSLLIAVGSVLCGVARLLTIKAYAPSRPLASHVPHTPPNTPARGGQSHRFAPSSIAALPSNFLCGPCSHTRCDSYVALGMESNRGTHHSTALCQPFASRRRVQIDLLEHRVTQLLHLSETTHHEPGCMVVHNLTWNPTCWPCPRNAVGTLGPTMAQMPRGPT